MTTTYADGTTNTEYSDRSIITYPMVLPLRRGVFAYYQTVEWFSKYLREKYKLNEEYMTRT